MPEPRSDAGTSDAQAGSSARVVGRWLRSPQESASRAAEGGLRLSGNQRASRPGEPLVSIVTICLDAAATIEQTITSVQRQTYPNVEYVVVDGGSADGTLEILRRHESTIDYFVSEPDGGLYKAMNKALGLASGEFVLVLNADDWYADDAVETLVRAKGYSGKDIVSALAEYVDADGRSDGVLRSMPFDASMRLRMPLRHETMLVPAAVYDRFGPYDESLRVIADFAFTLRLFEAGLTHYEVPRPLLHFRKTGVSSTSPDLLARERRQLVAASFPFLDDADLDQLAVISRLRPAGLVDLARRHADRDTLIETLGCYVRDQLARDDAPAWTREPVAWTALPHNERRPKVSVILPVYGAASTVEAAIHSVLAQTLTAIELVCIDDASPDGSRAILERHAAADPRVRVLVNESNLGLGATRNRGMRAARGAYVFQLDPDDTMPPAALERLYSVAVRHDSEMVKGAYLREQLIHGRGAGHAERRSLCGAAGPWVNTDLARTPALLKTTEGHWSYLYEASFARRIAYPTDLKMGQDSIFLVQALARARKVTVTDELVYHYGANPQSAMNTFNFRKFCDAVEWRRRAWHALVDRGHRATADHLVAAYWGDDFFRALHRDATVEQCTEVLARLAAALREAGISRPAQSSTPLVRRTLQALIDGGPAAAREAIESPEDSAMPRGRPAREPAPNAPSAPGLSVRAAPARGSGRPVRVATWVSRDHGGAGTGSQRRVEALRRHGVDASIHALVVNSKHPHVHRVVPRQLQKAGHDQNAVWKEVRQRAVLPAQEIPGFRAAELFSSPDAVVDEHDLKASYAPADVVHLHWVVGMLDLERLPAQLADKPVVWTLADMNAFTGGCHYSEGCEGYRRECRACPLLGGESDLAHQNWLRKRKAYAQLKRLHIVCPSKWMAERVAASSLLGGRPVHYIPNAFPVDRFVPTNKLVARARLGLPLDRKLLLFGADSLQNTRKGGDHLKAALERLKASGGNRNVEVIVFGDKSIDLPLPIHPMGHVSDDVRLAQVYSAADAFVFPSLEDNAPLTVGEAMLCGTPVVAFPVGNVPDLLEHGRTGYIARHLDAEDLCQGIRWALEADGRLALQRSLACRLRAERFHDPATAVERHLHVYQEAMREAT